MQMANKRCNWLLFQKQIAPINVLSAINCILFDKYIISTNECLRYCSDMRSCSEHERRTRTQIKNEPELRAWTASLNCEPELRAWTACLNCEHELRAWTASLNCELKLRAWAKKNDWEHKTRTWTKVLNGDPQLSAWAKLKFSPNIHINRHSSKLQLNISRRISPLNQHF